LSDHLDREIDFDFDFDFDSFVRGGRGEAVCMRVRHASLTLGLIWDDPRGAVLSNRCCYRYGFKLLLYVLSLARAVSFVVHRMGFKVLVIEL